MLNELEVFASILDEKVNKDSDCIAFLATEYNVKQLIERIDKRLELTEELKKFDDLDKFTPSQLWTTYKQVIPHIGSSGVSKDGLSSELVAIIQDLRIRYLEEQQETKIKELENKIRALSTK